MQYSIYIGLTLIALYFTSKAYQKLLKQKKTIITLVKVDLLVAAFVMVFAYLIPLPANLHSILREYGAQIAAIIGGMIILSDIFNKTKRTSSQ